MLGKNATRKTQLDPAASYVVATVLPNVVDEHDSLESREREFSLEEVMQQFDLTGVPVTLNHQGKWEQVGWTDGYKPGKRTDVLLRLDPSDALTSLFAKNALFGGYYRGVSLGHNYTTKVAASRRPGALDVSKQAIEISLCSRGKRPGSDIAQFYPSKNALLCQDYETLSAFASIYGYQVPPRVTQVTAPARTTPALRAYVDTLYDDVAKRRDALLKNEGYIAASRSYNATTTTMMSESTPTLNNTAAQAQAGVPQESAIVGANGGGQMTSPPPQQQQQQASKTATATSTHDDLSSKDKDSLVAIAKQSTALAESLQARLEAFQAQADAAQKEADGQARTKVLALLKAERDRLSANTDVVPLAKQKFLMGNFDAIESKLASAESAQKFEEENAMMVDMAVNASRDCVDNYNTQRASHKTQRSQEVEQIASHLGQVISRAKHNEARMSGQLPRASGTTVPKGWSVPTQTRAPVAAVQHDDDDDVDDKPFSLSSALAAPTPTPAQQSLSGKKRGNVEMGTIVNQGTVLASASAGGGGHQQQQQEAAGNANEQLETFTQNTPGWAGLCAREVNKINPDTGMQIYASYDELAKGGHVAVRTGKVLRGPGGKDIHQTVLVERFEEAKDFGPQDYVPTFYNKCVADMEKYRPSADQMRAMRSLGGRLDPLVSSMSNQPTLSSWS